LVIAPLSESAGVEWGRDEEGTGEVTSDLSIFTGEPTKILPKLGFASVLAPVDKFAGKVTRFKGTHRPTKTRGEISTTGAILTT
jgi:hypothetical protein